MKKQKEEPAIVLPPLPIPIIKREWWGIKKNNNLRTWGGDPDRSTPMFFVTREDAQFCAGFGDSIVKIKLQVQEEHWK